MNKFTLGQTVMTATVATLIEQDTHFADFVQRSFARYVSGNWGEMDEEDKQQNEEALINNDNRIFAAYEKADHPDWKIWIITEYDRSVTTILFPSDY